MQYELRRAISLRLLTRWMLGVVLPLGLASLFLLIQSAGATDTLISNSVPTIYTQTAQWAEDNGDTVQLNKWSGQPLIIAMAYTECTRVCNATLHKLEEAQTVVDQQKKPVQFIIISFDPSIDNPTSWSYYRRQHHLTERSNWHFLTGTTSATKKLANSLGIKFWLDEDHVMHDLRILYINPDGSIKTFLDWDHQEVASLFK